MRHLSVNEIAELKEAYMTEEDFLSPSLFKNNFAILIGSNTVWGINELFQKILADLANGRFPNSSTVSDSINGYYYIQTFKP